MFKIQQHYIITIIAASYHTNDSPIAPCVLTRSFLVLETLLFLSTSHLYNSLSYSIKIQEKVSWQRGRGGDERTQIFSGRLENKEIGEECERFLSTNTIYKSHCWSRRQAL